MDKVELLDVYGSVREQRLELWTATEREITAELNLRRMTLAALLAGVIVGKNDNEREAQARAKFAYEYAELEEAQRAARAAKFEFDLAMLRLAEVRALLRIEELAAGVRRNGEQGDE